VILRIRSCARWFAAAWLIGQIAMVGITVGAIGALPARAVLAGHCECPGSPQTATCPMHGKSAAQSHHGNCAMRQASMPSIALLSTAANFPTVPQVAALEPPPAASPVHAVSLDVRTRSIPPEAPPPRG